MNNAEKFPRWRSAVGDVPRERRGIVDLGKKRAAIL